MNGMDGQNKPTEENNMRQNRILNYIGAASLLLAVCACGKEDLNTTTDTGNGGTVAALPEGTFVVDYSVSDGEISRADQDRLNTSISSLLYLLYDSEGQLVKEREIPGIGTDTKWPLTRENMSWEQREALKDTLNVEMTYTAVFLANTDAELFKDTSDEAEQVLFYKTVTEGPNGTSETTYANLQDVYLKLPSVPFNDKNMFYISKHTLSAKNADGTTVEYDRDTPYNCPVTLKRLVSRMDMNGITITDELVKQGIGDNFKDIFVNGINAKYAELIESLESQQQTNVTWIQNCDELKGKLKLDIEGDIPETFKENYVSYKEQLYTACKESVVGENNDWSMFTRMTFNLNNMHNRMSIKELTSSCDNSITPPTYTYPITEGKATWIGFAYNESANKMLFTGITLKDEAETTLELKFEESKEISLQKNGLVTYACNPFNVKPSGTTYSASFTVAIDMGTVYGDLETLLSDGFSFDSGANKRDDFKGAIEKLFNSWGVVSLTFNIPDTNQFVFTTTITEQTNP